MCVIITYTHYTCLYVVGAGSKGTSVRVWPQQVMEKEFEHMVNDCYM